MAYERSVNDTGPEDKSAGEAPPPKSVPLPVIPDQIPTELKSIDQWVCWRYRWDDDAEKWTKHPFNPRTGNLAKSTDPKTWTSFDVALKRYQESQDQSWRFDGIGLVLTDKNNIVGFDLDHCRDPEAGDIEQLARDIVQGLPSYWETSTSGTGLRGFAFGRKPGSRCRSGDFEMYSTARYLAITGYHMEGTPTTVEAIQSAVDAVYAQIFPPKDTYSPGSHTNGTHLEYDDQIILDAARRATNGAEFIALFDEGNRQRHLHDDGSPDYSRSDAALMRLLTFFTKHEEQLDRLFRVSAFNRPKWESRADYRQSTIDLAIRSTPDQWSGPAAKRNGQPADEQHISSNSDSEDIGPPMTLAEVVAVFRRWLHMPHLIGALYVLLGTYAANKMSGDPLWLMLVGGSGWGKTELLISIMPLPHVHMASTLTEASLLSGTSRREKGKDSTGGILRKIGEFGYLLCKDFTSILSMNREASTAMLAALREIFDGNWTRHVGVDGGRTMGWKGKLAVIAGCTGAIDRFHAVVGALGERFVSFRLKDLDATQQGTQALRLVGQEVKMRQELSEAVARLFRGVDLPEKANTLDDEETKSLVALASLAALCRSPVIRDHTGEIELILDQEAPSRLVMSLCRLYTGMQAIGVSREDARPLIHKVAFDCMSALRRDIFDRLADNDDKWKTQELATALGYPYQTTKRTLEDLTAHGVVCRHRNGKADEWNISDAAFRLFQTAKQVFPAEMSNG